MCLNPLRIENPWRGMHGKVAVNGTALNFDSTLSFLKDTTSQYIEIPCGHCPQCMALKQSYKVQRCQMENLGNDLYFCTLTYNPEMIRRITTSTGETLLYADISDVQNMMKRLRKNNAFGVPFRYMCVSEYGSKRHRPHFHIIFSIPALSPAETLAEKESRAQEYHDIVLSEWKRNIATTIAEKDTQRYKKGDIIPNTRCPEYVPLCTYVNNHKGRNFDFHYVNPSATEKGSADVAFYVSKYTQKCDEWYEKLEYKMYKTLPYDEFKEVKHLIAPRCLTSKHWGCPTELSDPRHYELVKEHIRAGINMTLQPNSEFGYSVFINPVTGQTFPLAPYFRRMFETLEDVMTRYYMRDPQKVLTTYDNMLETDHESYEQAQRKYERYERTCERIAYRYLQDSGLDIDV